MGLEEFLNCRLNFSAPQASFGTYSQVLSYFNFVTAVIAFVIYSYILICYSIKRKNDLNQGQWLIIAVCAGVLSSCGAKILSQILLKHVHIKNDNIRDIFRSILFTVHFHFNINNAFFLTTLLSAYRYFCICKSIKKYIEVFSAKRIRWYLSAYFFSGVVMVCMKEAFRYLSRKSCLSLTFCSLYFTSFNVFYVFSLTSTTYFHVKATRKLGTKISEEQRLIRKQPRTYFDSCSEDFKFQYDTRADYYNSREHETFKEEINYLRVIRVYALIFTPILLLKYLFWLVLSYNALKYDVYFSESKFGLITGHLDLVVYTILETLLKLNFVFFIKINEDFRLRVMAPMYCLQKRFCSNCSPDLIWKDIRHEPAVNVKKRKKPDQLMCNIK